MPGPDEGARPASVPRPRQRKRDLPRDHLGRLRAPGEPDAMAHLKHAQREPPAAARARDLARSALAERRFFEAVTYCDLIRKDPVTPEAERPLWRALAQVAAGLCHLQRGNPGGAQAVLARAARGLAEHAGAAPGLGAEAVAATVRTLDAQLAHGAPVADPPAIVLGEDPGPGSGLPPGERP